MAKPQSTGAIPDPSELDPKSDAPKPQSNAERVEAIRAELADAAAGLTASQAKKLRAWWTHVRRPDEPLTLAPNVLVERFLNPPPRWAPGHEDITGYTRLSGKVRNKVLRDDGTSYDNIIDHSITLRDGIDDFDAERAKFITIDDVYTYPTLTLQVTGYSWEGGPTARIGHVMRSQLILWQGEATDRYVSQALEIGLARIIQPQGRLRDLSGLTCPAPTLVDPDGRIRLENYSPSQTAHVHQYVKASKPSETKLQLTIDAILEITAPKLAMHNMANEPVWLSWPAVKCRANADGYYWGQRVWDQQEFELNAFVALKFNVDPGARNRHGEPVIEILEPLPEAVERYRSTMLVPFMAANPGSKTDHPEFPLPTFAIGA
jgi:hypothetical protein